MPGLTLGKGSTLDLNGDLLIRPCEVKAELPGRRHETVFPYGFRNAKHLDLEEEMIL